MCFIFQDANLPFSLRHSSSRYISALQMFLNFYDKADMSYEG